MISTLKEKSSNHSFKEIFFHLHEHFKMLSEAVARWQRYHPRMTSLKVAIIHFFFFWTKQPLTILLVWVIFKVYYEFMNDYAWISPFWTFKTDKNVLKKFHIIKSCFKLLLRIFVLNFMVPRKCCVNVLLFWFPLILFPWMISINSVFL